MAPTGSWIADRANSASLTPTRYCPNTAAPATRPMTSWSIRDEKVQSSVVERTDKLTAINWRRCDVEKLRLGRHRDTVHRYTIPADEATSCCPIRDQAPNPAAAIVIPTQPPDAFAISVRSIRRRKSMAF